MAVADAMAPRSARRHRSPDPPHRSPRHDTARHQPRSRDPRAPQRTR